MPTQTRELSDIIEAADALLRSGERRFLAIAGAPGSGKSTLVEQIRDQLQATWPEKVAILPMDGFHYDDAILNERGRRPWKGAPDTFDVGGLHSILQRLKDPKEGPLAVPVFDRDLEISRGSARLIPPEVRLILVEGNYLLLDQEPWSSLAPCFDLTVMISVPQENLRERLRRRWVHYGLNKEQIAHKLDGNDLPNGRMVAQQSRQADMTFIQM